MVFFAPHHIIFPLNVTFTNRKAASGALASAIANTLVYPLDLSKVLIQTQVKKNKPKSGSNGIPTPPSESDLEDSVYKQKWMKITD